MAELPHDIEQRISGDDELEQRQLRVFIAERGMVTPKLSLLASHAEDAYQEVRRAMARVESAGDISSDHHLYQSLDAAIERMQSADRAAKQEARRLISEHGVDWEQQRQLIEIQVVEADDEDEDDEDIEITEERTRALVLAALNLLGLLHALDGTVINVRHGEVWMFLTVQSDTVECLTTSAPYRATDEQTLLTANTERAILGAFLVPFQGDGRMMVGAFSRLTLPSDCSAEQLAPFLHEMINRNWTTAHMYEDGAIGASAA